MGKEVDVTADDDGVQFRLREWLERGGMVERGASDDTRRQALRVIAQQCELYAADPRCVRVYRHDVYALALPTPVKSKRRWAPKRVWKRMLSCESVRHVAQMRSRS